MHLQELGVRCLPLWKVLILPPARTAEHVYLSERYMETSE